VICVLCSGVQPCDCWKSRLTPAERKEAQAATVAKWELKHDRQAFEERQRAKRILDAQRWVCGQSGLVTRGPGRLL